MKKPKVMTILGTRPEIIRLSRVIALLDEYTEHVLVHTGQNYDYELNQVFFEDLGVRAPDHCLGVDTSTLGHVLGETLIQSEDVMALEKPDVVVILGDTNSSIAAIIAKRRCIPVYHLEAGNRCFDGNVPEETNRKIIDHIADFNLVYSEHARRNLLAEGIPSRRIYLIGSPMHEVLNAYRDRIDASTILQKLKLTSKGYFVVSCHRQENVDNGKNLRRILHLLNTLVEQYDVPVIVSTHPRTRKSLDALAVDCDERIQFLAPFSFSDYVNLQLNALCTLSDSGTISEESAILGIPAVTIRNAMERPEALDCGSISLVGLDTDSVLPSVKLAIEMTEAERLPAVPEAYQVLDTSRRVVRLILGTFRLSNEWDGIVGPVSNQQGIGE
ncbi:MAG: UDP-N-acetylglucosamine 2-epimerase [Kiritimatiellia bacterium]|jgi:UDP-N-acetylglucosamine 2-epimerase